MTTAVRSPRLPWRTPALVAATVVIVVAAVFVAQRSDNDDTGARVGSLPTAPLVVPTTHLETVPSTASTVAATASSLPPVRACDTDTAPASAINEINGALMASRQATAELPDCLAAVPDLYTGLPPACWSQCSPALRSFGTVDTHEVFSDAVTPDFWVARVPVTYEMGDGTYLDVLESWQVRHQNSKYIVGDFAIENPMIDRLAGTAALNSYLDLIDSGQWIGAATLTQAGATEPDLQRLAPASFSISDLATALSDWCSGGCDTAEVRPADLIFEDSFLLERGGSELLVYWWEGSIAIGGLPAPNPSM